MLNNGSRSISRIYLYHFSPDAMQANYKKELAAFNELYCMGVESVCMYHFSEYNITKCMILAEMHKENMRLEE